MAPTHPRMSEPLTEGGRAPAVDTLAAPPDEGTPDDALGALLAEGQTDPDADVDNPLLSDDQRAQLRELGRIKPLRTELKKKYEALGRRIAELQPDLLALVDDPDLGLDYAQPFASYDEDGMSVRPYVQRAIYPRYRDTDEPGVQFTAEDVAEAVRATGNAEITAMLVTKVAHKEWNSWLVARVKAWRAMTASKDGPVGVMRDGRYVDFDGEPLDVEEQGDPVDDSLALPRQVRRVVEIVAKPDLRFRRDRTHSVAVAAVNAAVEEAEAAALAEGEPEEPEEPEGGDGSE